VAKRKPQSTSKKDPARQLDKLRERIDRIDARILESLAKRGDLVEEIGRIKRDENQSFHRPARERELLRRLIKENPGPYPDEAVETIFREIMSASLALESPLSVAYGAEGAGNPRAAIRRRFGRSARARREKTVADALLAVSSGWAHYAVVAVEDDVAGFHGPALDALCDSTIRVSGEIIVRSGARSERFLIAGGEPHAPTGHDRTSAVFVVRNEPGALLSVLTQLDEAGINMTCIESRPLAGQPWQYRFYVDLDGHREQDPVSGALGALGSQGAVFRVLGSYPRDESQ
jgi:chorismate mutase-like protein